MIPDAIDPSLCTGEPLLDSLEDGFSPPAAQQPAEPVPQAQPGVPAEAALGTKSPF